MKKLLKALGFKKADEMEQSIQLQSIRLTWLYAVVFLGCWSIYEVTTGANNGYINFIPLILLFSQAVVMFLSQLFFRSSMTKGEDDEEKESQFRYTLIIIAIVIAIGVASFALARFITG